MKFLILIHHLSYVEAIFVRKRSELSVDDTRDAKLSCTLIYGQKCSGTMQMISLMML